MAFASSRYNANPQYWDDLATSDIWRLGLDVGDGQDNLVMESFLSQYCLLVLWGSGNSYCIYSDKIYTEGILLKSLSWINVWNICYS
ncbi:hypothetical protein [Brasilonema octagenarum]|uniref:hypothetical protein n=1 Tax=Brasilonema octagenarum TaxID=417105 RepID=UPI00145C94D4|nr:hypothetical protein [Brasilonema octagenarum]